MAEFYEMPAISPTMEVGTLVEWRIAEGESFESSSVVADVGTDKANMEAEIFDDGVMLKHLIDEGDEVPPGFPMAIWGQSTDEDISALVEKFAEMKKALDAGEAGDGDGDGDGDESDGDTDDGDSDESSAPKPAKQAKEAPRTVDTKPREWKGKSVNSAFMDPPGDIRAASSDSDKRIVASPLAKKIASERGVDLARVRGSGPGGRIVREDVENAPVGAGPALPSQEDREVRIFPMRKTIAKRLTESHQHIPVFFLTVEFDMQGFVDLRKQIKAQLPDTKVSYNDMLIKAVARALSEFPMANASWGKKTITQHGNVDVGVAVALDEGLITPVVRNANMKTLSEIAAEVRDLAGRAREGKLDQDEYTGGTFTISNLGMMGIEEFTAIINPPEVGILAVGALQQKPVVVDGELTVGWRMKLTMSCDHRVLDGAKGAEFLQVLKRYVESPTLLLV